MTDIAKIAAGLSRHTRADLCATDPRDNYIIAPVASLIDFCLAGLAETETDNRVLLTPLGLSVRNHILGGTDGQA